MHTTQQHFLLEPRAILLTLSMALVFVAGTAVGVVLDLDLPNLSAPVSMPAGDRSYDALEETRIDRGLTIGADEVSSERRDKIGGP